ncbi:hypothetical protein XELAEV_18018370mg [Xenopus laevis]|uniref:Uncharacterized protein n=1 Tax=Xenopus laevis TaxID=8355 RepID=A0A974DF63_XENLA|nr:hypothetical protein XELAEV_18018370mg [Xenopus laevis]
MSHEHNLKIKKNLPKNNIQKLQKMHKIYKHYKKNKPHTHFFFFIITSIYIHKHHFLITAIKAIPLKSMNTIEQNIPTRFIEKQKLGSSSVQELSNVLILKQLSAL